jgi:hypothetical protein
MKSTIMESILDEIEASLVSAEANIETNTDNWFADLFWLCQRFSDAILEYGRWRPTSEDGVNNRFTQSLHRFKKLLNRYIRIGCDGTSMIEGEEYDIGPMLQRFLVHTDERLDFLELEFKERVEAAGRLGFLRSAA